MITKPDKDTIKITTINIKIYILISLMNTEVKMLSKILANKIQQHV